MNPQEVMVANYLRYLSAHRLDDQSFNDDELFAAWEDVEECIDSDPELAWKVLLDVVDRCDPANRYIVGAGALETFFFQHVVPFSERIEEQLRTNAAFLDAFRFTYMGGVPERIWRHFNGILASLGVPEHELSEWSWVDTERYPLG